LARKILLADDSVTAQNMGRKILADAGYDVVTVNNGSAALKRITEIKPDLIVLDVYMPGYSGLEVCQRLKDAAATAHIPVLLTVGKLEPFKPEEARRVKADAHIVKPFEASELLSAITRLEDRMVPQQPEGARFSTSVSGVERFGGEASGRTTESKAGADTGWKSRLGFPSKKKKEEPEPEPEPEDIAAAATFRDFRKAKSKTGASVPFTVKEPPPPGQEPGLVPDIPRDITPEELDALSALAAKLDGPIPAAENVAPLAEKMGPGMAPAAELAAAKTEVPKTEVDAPAPATDAKKEVETPARVAEAAVEVHQHEAERPEAQHPEMPAAKVAVAVNTALFAQEPAPVDKHDEPMFAAAASALGQAAEEKIEAKPSEAVANESEATEAAEASAPAEAVAAKDEESKPEASEAEEPVPSDAELAEALRLLTPATGHVDVSTVPSHGTLEATGQLLKEEAARNVAAGPRWVAEPVALTTEEAAISLEAEMFSTFAATFAAAPGGEIESVGITRVSAIAAAVENRLAEAELAASTKALSEQGAERSSETTAAAAETSVVEGPAEVVAAVSNAASPVVDGFEPDKLEPEKIEAEKLEAERKDSPAKIAEEAPAAQVAAATFADAGSQDEVEATAEYNGEPVSGTTAAVAEGNQDLSSDSGGQDSMGKDVKAKSGKSNWHQIHTAPASAANSDVVEAAKQAESRAGESPKAMAAAAAAEGSASPSATDASTIASIVDSVMADLRPKIVEEIAKKLAGR
jgi:CheY-like chemotaxis protein